MENKGIMFDPTVLLILLTITMVIYVISYVVLNGFTEMLWQSFLIGALAGIIWMLLSEVWEIYKKGEQK